MDIIDSKAIETLFIRALGNSRIENPVVGDLIIIQRQIVETRVKNIKMLKEYCDKKFKIETFRKQIRQIIGDMIGDKSLHYSSLDNLINFTLIIFMKQD